LSADDDYVLCALELIIADHPGTFPGSDAGQADFLQLKRRGHELHFGFAALVEDVDEAMQFPSAAGDEFLQLCGQSRNVLKFIIDDPDLDQRRRAVLSARSGLAPFFRPADVVRRVGHDAVVFLKPGGEG